MTPSTVRDKLKLALNITGLRVFDTIPENIVPPAAVVGQLSLEWDLVMARGADTATVDIFVVAGRMSDRSAQDYLDSLLTATGAIVGGGIIADSIPGWYWPIICLAILAVGMCVLARGDS